MYSIETMGPMKSLDDNRTDEKNENLVNLIKCSICDQTCLRPWGERNGYKLYSCLSCTHKFADLKNQEMSRSDPERFREEFTHGLMSSDEKYYEHLAAGETPGNATAITTEHILNICRKNRLEFSGNWLDIGCGSGYLLSEVQNSGFIAHGIEPGGWGQIAVVRKGLQIVQGFLTNDTFAQRFDVVSATDVIEHIPDPVEFLKLMAGYVVSGGYIIISIPFADSLEAKLMGARWDMVEPPTHCQFFSMQSLKLALQKAGLEVVDSCQFNIRNLRGLLRQVYLRQLVDILLPGPQLVCLIQKTQQTLNKIELKDS
jgi:2-polyprenyl-3-methyl-5-hydroxy-6-metoxy-1,4-benzoquinol methylase